MNKLFTLVLTIGILQSNFAQFPTITSTNQIPSINDTVNYINANTFGFNPDGSGGAIDVLWDYQSLFNAGTTINFWFEDPSTTAEAANFPTATVAMVNSVSPGYEYFNTATNTISRLGYTDPTAGSIYYDQGWNRYEFPITPGVNWSATYTGTMTPFGFGEDSVTIAYGNYQASPDQYGTLILPPSTFGGQPEYFDSVVRVHVIESFQIILWMIGTPAITININDDYYFYFDEETQEPVLIYGTTTDDAGGAPQTVLRYQNVTGTGTPPISIKENKVSLFEIYPNPSNGIFNITTKDNLLDARVKVIDNTGKLILNTKLNSNYIDLTSLNSGIYSITISNNGFSQTKRIVVK